MPVYDDTGQIRSLRRASVEIDEATLKQVAELTGGSYFHATDAETLTKVPLFVRTAAPATSRPFPTDSKLRNRQRFASGHDLKSTHPLRAKGCISAVTPITFRGNISPPKPRRASRSKSLYDTRCLGFIAKRFNTRSLPERLKHALPSTGRAKTVMQSN